MVKYQLKKRFRRDEEIRRNITQPWTKSMLDLDESTILERNAKSWCLLLVFYIIFYSLLAIMFAICLQVFRLNLDLDLPRVLQKQPGLSYEPSHTPNPDTLKPVANVINYREKSFTDVKRILTQIVHSLSKYSQDVPTYFAPCSPNDEYGYATRNPCVFLKVNRIIGFKTEPYENIFDLPRIAPLELRNHIDSLPPDQQTGRIWFTCKANHTLELGFYPSPSVNVSAVDLDRKKVYTKAYGANQSHTKFYSERDFERVVALQLKGMPADRTVKVSCSMWAKNIAIGKEGKGAVVFTMHIDSSKVNLRGSGIPYRLF